MPEEVINAVLYAGLPTLAITFLLFTWTYYKRLIKAKTGHDAPDEKGESEQSEEKTGNFVTDKWFEFGGGYYGLMALITFIHLEIVELFDLGSVLTGLSGVEQFIKALIEFLVQMAVESIMNMVNAFLWWKHWSNELPVSEGSGFMWIGISYAGYLLGSGLAAMLKKR